ncbi:MAG: hypothetical protein ACPHK8_04430 [Thermoplasmatota archaeon]
MDGVLLSALASGAAVVFITVLADRLGGTLGGLLATAPVTTSAAILYLAAAEGNAAVGGSILDGAASIFSVLAAMPAYFYVQKWLRDPIPVQVRILVGLLSYVAVFTIGTLGLNALTPNGYAWVWMPASVLLVLLLVFTFMNAHIPPRFLRGEKGRLTILEAVIRFAAGFGIIYLVNFVKELDPSLSTAWAVFPGTFLVSLAVLGFRNGAAFSARASQGGVLGGLPVAAYILTLFFVLPLREGVAWLFLSQVPAWVAYFAVLVPLMKWQQRLRPMRLARREPVQE